MEVYVLDSLLRRVEVIDKFESLIWTERFSDVGDFELVIQSTLENRNLFLTDTRLALNESYRVMVIESVENTDDADGKTMLTIKGRSLEKIFEDRVLKLTLANTTTEPKWTFTGTPGDALRKIFNDICVLGLLDPGDVIPFLMPGTIFPVDTIGEPTDVVMFELDFQSVLSAFKLICGAYNMGFRLIRNFDTSQLYFNIYTGSDRTTSQTALPAVVFSAELDNLSNTSEFTSIAIYKNVAYVFSPVGHEIVFPLDVDPSISGFDRRVLLVNATDITDTDPTMAAQMMIQRGLDELAKNRQLSAFDGELNQNSGYKYGVDYRLGDLIEIRNSDNFTNDMQVTEHIFTSDATGDRSYPTLTLNTFITPGSWLAWDYNQVWADLGATEYWADA